MPPPPPPPGDHARVPRRLRIVLAAIGVAVLCAALVLMYPGGGSPVQVGVVGDSIVALSRPALTQALGSNYSYRIDGQVGATMAGRLTTIFSFLEQSSGAPNDMVVELGTNDANGLDTNWPASFSSEVSALRGTSCVVLVNINDRVSPPHWSPAQNAIARQIDDAMVRTSILYPNFHVLDWNSAVQAHPSWVDSGGIHPTEAGRQGLASLVAQALHTYCGN